MEIQKNNAAQFEKKDNATPSEKKLAAEFGMTVEEYRHQHKNYVDTAKQEKEHRPIPPDPKIEDENEENCTTGAGMMRGSRERDEKLTGTIQAVQYVGSEAVSNRRIEEERKALEEMKSKHEQNRHHHEQHHDDYQVIEGGRESIVEDNYVKISPYTSSSEQDNERRGYESQSPNLPAMAEGMRVSHQSKLSPRDQHYINERGEGASLPSYLNDGSHDIPPNRSPHSSRRPPSPPPPRDTHPPPPADPVPPPPPDPHHQFTIGSMVCLDVQKGEPLYGVLQWVGTIPSITGTIAGVELVSDYEKCAYSFNTINRSGH